VTPRLRVLIAFVAAFGLLAASPQATVAKKRHRHPGCGKFCRQAGGFGGGPSTKVPVKIRSQEIRVDRDGIIGIRAYCTLSRTCDGAILVDGHVSYGRADLRIPAHKTRTVYVAVPSKGRRYLKRHGHDRQVYATVPLKGDQPVSVSKRLTLLLPHS